MVFVLGKYAVAPNAVVQVAKGQDGDPAALANTSNNLILWRVDNSLPEAEYHARLNAMEAAGNGVIQQAGSISVAVGAAADDPHAQLAVQVASHLSQALKDKFSAADIEQLIADAAQATGINPLLASAAEAAVGAFIKR